jgi:hypothetical protein
MWRNNSRGEKTLCNACGVRLHRLLNKARMGMSSAHARAGAAPVTDAPARRAATAGALPSRLPAAAPGSAPRARARSLPCELPDGGAASAAGAAAGLLRRGQLSPPTPRKRGWADLGGGRPSPAGNAWAAQHAAGVAALHEQPPRGWPFPPFPPPPHAAPAAMPNAKLCDSVHQRLDEMALPPLCPVDESRASDSSTTPHGHPCPSHQRRADARQAARHSLDAAPPPGCAPPPGHLQIENPLGLDPELLSAVDLRFDDLACRTSPTTARSTGCARLRALPEFHGLPRARAMLPRLPAEPAGRRGSAAQHRAPAKPWCVCVPPTPCAACAAAVRRAGAGRRVRERADRGGHLAGRLRGCADHAGAPLCMRSPALSRLRQAAASHAMHTRRWTCHLRPPTLYRARRRVS